MWNHRDAYQWGYSFSKSDRNKVLMQFSVHSERKSESALFVVHEQYHLIAVSCIMCWGSWYAVGRAQYEKASDKRVFRRENRLVSWLQEMRDDYWRKSWFWFWLLPFWRPRCVLSQLQKRYSRTSPITGQKNTSFKQANESWYRAIMACTVPMTPWRVPSW